MPSLAWAYRLLNPSPEAAVQTQTVALRLQLDISEALDTVAVARWHTFFTAQERMDTAKAIMDHLDAKGWTAPKPRE